MSDDFDRFVAISERAGLVGVRPEELSGTRRMDLDGRPLDPLAEPPEPLPLVPGVPVAYAPAVVLITAPTGGGKSTMVEVFLQDAAVAGLAVAYVSGEVSEAEANARAADIARRRGDVLDDELCEQLRRIRYLDLADVIRAAWDDPEAWATGVAERYKVIALDPLSSVASSLDLDFDKSNADYAAFHDRLLKPITDRGVSVLLVDNIGHDPDAKGRAKGASAKQDKADVILSCKRCAQPEGLLVSATKVRSVRAPFARGDRWTFARETLRVERDHGEQQDGRPTVLMERVSRRLEVEPGLTRTKIRDGVQGKHEFVAAALEHLIEGGYVEQRETGPVPVHFVVREFRKEAAVPRSQAVPAPSPNGAEVFGPPVPSFKGRGPGTTLASDCEEAEAIRLLEKHEATT